MGSAGPALVTSRSGRAANVVAQAGAVDCLASSRETVAFEGHRVAGHDVGAGVDVAGLRETVRSCRPRVRAGSGSSTKAAIPPSRPAPRRRRAPQGRKQQRHPRAADRARSALFGIGDRRRRGVKADRCCQSGSGCSAGRPIDSPRRNLHPGRDPSRGLGVGRRPSRG